MAFLQSRNGISILAGLTGLIHIGLGIATSNTLFILNGIGYFALLYATYWTPGFLQGQASLIRWAFIGYTALTIVMYFVSWGLEGFLQPPGIATKLIEVLLLVGLWASRER